MLRRWSTVVRGIGLLFALLIVMLSVSPRVRTYLLTRQVHAVLAGLERVKIDQTGEVELLKIVPGLVLSPSPGNAPLRSYHVQLRNAPDRGYYEWTAWVPEFLLRGKLAPSGLPLDKWSALGLLPKFVYVLGRRHLSFGASVTVSNGTVSSISYELDPDIFFGAPAPNFVVARSMHALWGGNRPRPIPVRSAEDENPTFRFGPVSGQFSWLAARDSSIGVAYTPDAPRS